MPNVFGKNPSASCKNCVYFDDLETLGLASDAEVGFGECKRYPPRFVHDADGEVERCQYPLVHRHDWCGEHNVALVYWFVDKYCSDCGAPKSSLDNGETYVCRSCNQHAPYTTR